jgi:agmatinase
MGMTNTNSSMKNIIIQGIQYDEKSSYQQGPKLAPPLIREVLYSGSLNLFAENGVSIETSSIVDKGDFEISKYFDIEEITKKHLDLERKIFTLGGDHSITFPIIKAHQAKYSKIDILHIDAHADLYDDYEGDKYSHACPFARIMENKFAVKLVQVGIRTLNTHQAEQAEKYDVEIHQMKNLDISKISKFENPLYVSLDMDAFDPAFAPGVSHHEPGGLTSRQVIDLIQNIEVEVIGADIVEYNPTRDFQNMTAFLAAKMMKEILVKMM